MTGAAAEVSVRLLLNQTSSGDTQFSSAFIIAQVNYARNAFAAILPESMLHDLRVYETTEHSTSSGFVVFRTDFLRVLKNKNVELGATGATKHAVEIKAGEEWRLKFGEDNALTKSGATNKYYRETGSGVECYPSTDAKLIYPYLKIPTALAVDGSTDNIELPLDVDDMVIQFAFEKCMGTARGDTDLALFLAKQRGYTMREMTK